MFWYAWNRAVFHDNFIPIYVAIRKMCKAIQETSLFKVGCMSNAISDFTILHRLRVFGIPHRPSFFFSVRWFPPPRSWIKLNCDGAAKGAPGLAGAGGIF